MAEIADTDRLSVQFKTLNEDNRKNIITKAFFVFNILPSYGPFQTTATFQRLHHLSCLCKSGYLCTESDLLKNCYLLR